MYLKILETLGLLSNPERMSEHFALIEVHYGTKDQKAEVALLQPEQTTISFHDNQSVVVTLVVRPGYNGWPKDITHQLTGTLGYHEGTLQEAVWCFADGTLAEVRFLLANPD